MSENPAFLNRSEKFSPPIPFRACYVDRGVGESAHDKQFIKNSPFVSERVSGDAPPRSTTEETTTTTATTTTTTQPAKRKLWPKRILVLQRRYDSQAWLGDHLRWS